MGSVFTGLTYGCARCHDHKYDPILQEDYYRLQAFFANTAARDDIALVSSAEIRRYRERKALWEEKTRDIRKQLDEIEAPKRRAVEKDYFDKYPAEIQAILKKPETERNLKRYAVKKGPLHPPISPQNMFQILSATLRRITLSPSYKVSGQIRTLSLTITVSLSIHSSPTMITITTNRFQ